MIVVKSKKDCCGCNACGDVCPKGAISFSADEEGFLYPAIDKSKCVNCGLCDRVCPQLRAIDLRGNEFSVPDAYAVMHKNLGVVFDSTSGGAFTACANQVYARKGFVGGALKGDDGEIHQYLSDNRGDLPKLRRSKYKQSDSRGFYKSVKKAVETERPVLVCGAPCQMVALRAYLGREYDNLYIMDFVCRGANSPLASRKYGEWREQQIGSRLVSSVAKNKELGWNMLTSKEIYADGTIKYLTKHDNLFTHCYLATNAFCRPSCYECKFKGVPLFSDVTVADCWCMDDVLKGMLRQNLGVTLMLLNNSKGRQLFDLAKSSMHIQAVDFERARKGNLIIDQSLPPPKYPREEVFRLLNSEGFQGLIDKFIKADRECVESFKTKVRRLLSRYRQLCKIHHYNPFKLLRLVRDNGFCAVVSGAPLIMHNRPVVMQIEGTLELGGDFGIGGGILKRTSFITNLRIDKEARLVTKGEVGIAYGGDVEVINDGALEIGANFGANQNLMLVCESKITIGDWVKCGRNVTIRDSNGGHWMNIPGYKAKKSITIGDHVWLCEGCTIMSGVKIGAGSVIGAKAVVFNDVPPNSLVLGNPAKVVLDNVQWKY